MTQAIRKSVPDPLEPVPFNIPPAYQATQKNGLRIVVFEDSRHPIVSFRLAFLSGDVNDPEGSTGLTSAMSALLTEGTRNYSSAALAEKIERLGASVSANSSDDFTVIAASSLALYTSEILQLMSEIVFRPIFPDGELDLYKRNSIENLKFQRSQPSFLANEQTSRILYGSHPYSKVSPTAADIEKLTREDLITLRSARLIPNNAILIAVGDFDRDLLLKEIDEVFGNWQTGEVPAVSFSQPPSRESITLTIVDRPGSAQSNIVLSNLAIERKSPDYFALMVMNQILGAGASSRVFMNLREEKGYTYGAYTRLDTKSFAGSFDATAEVRTSVTGDSLREFFFELERIRDEKVTEQELDDAKNFLTGVFPIRAETQEGLTNLIVSQQLHNLPNDYLQTYRDDVDAVTIRDVERVARKYILPDRIAMVIVGDAREVLPQVRDYSQKIEIFDTEGNPQNMSDFNEIQTEETAEIAGRWELQLDFQGQNVPVSLILEQNGESISGKLETMLGNGEIANGTVKGRKLSATASTMMQGQNVEFVINGSVENDTISGTILAPIIPDPLSFTGTRTP